MTQSTIGDRIATLRKRQGLTQKELAEKINVTDKAVSKWERNLSCPDISSIPALAEILGTSADELLNTTKKAEDHHKKEERNRIIDLILKAVPLAMGVSLVVTSLLREINLYSGFSMTGIALFCLALLLLKSTKTHS